MDSSDEWVDPFKSVYFRPPAEFAVRWQELWKRLNLDNPPPASKTRAIGISARGMLQELDFLIGRWQDLLGDKLEPLPQPYNDMVAAMLTSLYVADSVLKQGMEAIKLHLAEPLKTLVGEVIVDPGESIAPVIEPAYADEPCDRCGMEARYWVNLGADGRLYFCDFHGRYYIWRKASNIEQLRSPGGQKAQVAA